MKLLCQQVAKSNLGEEMDYDKVKKLTSDAKFEVGDVKASVAAVEFILTSSSRHDVEEDVLSSELQQLGLPREHSTSLVRVYSDNLAAFTSKLKSESLRFSRLEDVRWRVDFVSRSSRHYIDPDIPEPEVTISLRVWDSLAGLHKMHKFTTTGDMVALLLEGLYDNTGRPEMEDEDVDDIEELDAQQSFWHSSFEEGDCEDDSRHTNERFGDCDNDNKSSTNITFSFSPQKGPFLNYARTLRGEGCSLYV
uniref:COMM domain-containing protein n=1 Tax=Timema poppense TaxID=170557 RepID=A0A7R9DK63_TIMPO|nr:unnamed protein product [Timema poppensis]